MPPRRAAVRPVAPIAPASPAEPDMTHEEMFAGLSAQIKTMGENFGQQMEVLKDGHNALSDQLVDISEKLGETREDVAAIKGAREEEHHAALLAATAGGVAARIADGPEKAGTIAKVGAWLAAIAAVVGLLGGLSAASDHLGKLFANLHKMMG